MKLFESYSKSKGFTIVELIIVIIIIGILASITAVSYSGIIKRAKETTIQLDLIEAPRKLASFQTYNSNNNFPDTIDCTVADSPTNKCIKSSGDNSFTYSVDNLATPRRYTLIITGGGSTYRVIEGSISSGPWIAGKTATPLAGKYVLGYDLTGLYQYKTSDTPLSAPQGLVGLDSGYPTYTSLVNPRANPSVDFSEYPAQTACMKLGGRLPNFTELTAIYTNKANLYGNNFTNNMYWASLEHVTLVNTATLKRFQDGIAFSVSKSASNYVRCVTD